MHFKDVAVVVGHFRQKCPFDGRHSEVQLWEGSGEDVKGEIENNFDT